MLRFKQRRGAFVVITGIMFFALIVCGAVAIDFGRLWTERWELQTAADAGSIAGAMQFMPPRDSMTYSDSARSYVMRNRAMADTITVDSVIKGNWDGPTRTWTPAGSPTNAVRVVVSQQASNLFMAGFGVPVPRMTARAIAWAGAPVATTNACIKPWAIPYELLMYKINQWRAVNDPSFTHSPTDYTRDFEPEDLTALQLMPPSARRFNLKEGAQSAPTAFDPYTTGNYQIMRLGKYWDYATQSYANPAPLNGANEYEMHISGAYCYGLAVNDSLLPQGGNIPGKTQDGVCTGGGPIRSLATCDVPAVCTQLDGSAPGTSTYGNCLDGAGQVGVDVKSAFFTCEVSCPGASDPYLVKLLGSFTIEKFYPERDQQNGTYDKSEIVGVFKPVQSQGAGGGGSTTLVKLILVQ